MKTRRSIGALFVVILMTGGGCAHVVSKDVRNQVDEGITFRQVFQSPDAYKGKVVVWGGVIINMTHQKEGTLVEVLQKPLEMDGQPEDVDRSEGRFLAFHKGFMDDALFAKGRRITVAGEVIGSRKMPIGEDRVHLPFITTREVYLWPERSTERYVPYWYYPGWYDPAGILGMVPGGTVTRGGVKALIGNFYARCSSVTSLGVVSGELRTNDVRWQPEMDLPHQPPR